MSHNGHTTTTTALAVDDEAAAALDAGALDAVMVVDAHGAVLAANAVAVGLAAAEAPLRKTIDELFGISWDALRAAAEARPGPHPIGPNGDNRARAGLVWATPLPGGRHIVVLRDESERVREREILGLMATAFEAASDAFEITDDHGEIVLTNAAHEAMTGYSLFDVTGERLTHLVEDHGTVVAIEYAMQRRESWHGLVACRTKSGARVHHDLRMTPVLDGRGQLVRFVSIRRDVTERVRMEEEHERMREQLVHADRLSVSGVLAARVAHEVKNPATFAIANVALARDEVQELRAAVDPALHGAVDGIQAMLADAYEGVNRVVALVNDLLSFSRPSTPPASRVDVADVVQSVDRLARFYCEGRAKFSVVHEPAPAVLIERIRLGQVLLNLVLNAAQAVGGAGGGSVRIQVGRRGESALIDVIDDGPGIAPEALPRIFDPFFSTKGTAGTGLGLAVSRDIVERAGGRIEVDSAPGRGTRVSVVLPAAPPVP